MLVEAAGRCDSSPFARLQPPVLLAADTYQRHPELPFSSTGDEKYGRLRLSTPTNSRSSRDLHLARPSRHDYSVRLPHACQLPYRRVGLGPQRTSTHSTASHQPSLSIAR